MDSAERFPDSANKNAHPRRHGSQDDAAGTEPETSRFVITPDCSHWPEFESPEFRELVLSIIATSIRLNPFQPSENDDERLRLKPQQSDIHRTSVK